MAPDPYVRTFPASHESWIRSEIDKLMQSIPDQPSWASDPLRAGECMILMRLVPPPATLPPSSHNVPTRGA